MPVKASGKEIRVSFPVTLRFRGSHCPSFKNSKLLTRGKLITKPEYQRIMQEITHAFESGLRSATLIADIETWTEGCHVVSTVWLQRFDDSRQWLPSLSVTGLEVEKGQEGCDLTLELL